VQQLADIQRQVNILMLIGGCTAKLIMIMSTGPLESFLDNVYWAPGIPSCACLAAVGLLHLSITCDAVRLAVSHDLVEGIHQGLEACQAAETAKQ
jgi:hypothetical protein